MTYITSGQSCPMCEDGITEIIQGQNCPIKCWDNSWSVNGKCPIEYSKRQIKNPLLIYYRI